MRDLDESVAGRLWTIVLAIRAPEGTFDTTPSAQNTVHSGGTLIVLGTREQVTRLGTLMAGAEPVDERPSKP